MASKALPFDINRVLFDENQIHARLQEIATEIDETYKGEEVVLICILKGAFMFLADLSRLLTVQHTIEFIAVSSYGASTTSSGNVKLVMDTRQDISGKNVLIIEDICDTGLTLSYLLQMLSARHPKTIECCVFLQKSKCLKVPDIRLKWVGFQVEPVFVVHYTYDQPTNNAQVGYGLDYAERYRTLGFVGELKEEAYKKH